MTSTTSDRPAPPTAAGGDTCTMFQRTLEAAGRRWSGAILFVGVAGARRFTEYRRGVPGISDRLLAQRLKELERQGLMEREVVPSTPVQILYRPTERGAELIAALQPLARWGARHLDDVAPEARPE